jgi:hypothetical protein
MAGPDPHGMNGCGSYVAAAYEEDQYWSHWAVHSESWSDLQYDNNDALGGAYFSLVAVCNWDCITYPASY